MGLQRQPENGQARRVVRRCQCAPVRRGSAGLWRLCGCGVPGETGPAEVRTPRGGAGASREKFLVWRGRAGTRRSVGCGGLRGAEVSGVRRSQGCGGLRGAEVSGVRRSQGCGGLRGAEVSGVRRSQGCGDRAVRTPREAERTRRGQGPHQAGSPRGVGGDLVRRGGLTGRGSPEGCAVLTAGGGSPGLVRQHARLPKAARRGRLAAIDRAASRASTCGNCASSGWPGCGARLPRLVRTCLRSLPDGSPAGRLRHGAGPSWAALVGPAGPSPATAGQAAASLTDEPPGRSTSRAGHGPAAQADVGEPGRPGAGPALRSARGLGLRQDGPTGSGLSRDRVTG